jgi:hypothetical protein
MRDRAAEFPEIPLPDGTETRLNVRVAVAAGTTRRPLVGDPAVQVVGAGTRKTVRLRP